MFLGEDFSNVDSKRGAVIQRKGCVHLCQTAVIFGMLSLKSVFEQILMRALEDNTQ